MPDAKTLPTCYLSYRMNKRLRKKKHKGEFNFLGFEATCVFRPVLQDDAVEEFLDRYIAFIEANNLGTGGGIDHLTMGQFITRCLPCRRKRNGKMQYRDDNATSEDRAKVVAWLEAQPEVSLAKGGDLVPAWWSAPGH